MWRGETLSQDVLERLGVGSIPQEKLAEINESVDWANQFLDYDTHFNRKERGQASISDLYDQTSKGQLVEKLTRDT